MKTYTDKELAKKNHSEANSLPQKQTCGTKLSHKAWHTVQQKQGSVQPTMQMKEGAPVNEDAGLENEADKMGRKVIGL